MPEINSNDGLMVWIMNRFSEVFENQAVLKGGMALKLLDCPRYTNDLDYVFVAFKSKKDIVPLIQNILEELPGAKIQHSLHSTSLRFLVSYQNFQTQIEANVADDCKARQMSTSSLAKPNNQLPRIISMMSFDWALAHKLAAWNERDLMRDIYDIYFMYAILDEMPDLAVLGKRLQKVKYSKSSKSKDQTKVMTLTEFLDKLQSAVESLTEEKVREELRDYLKPDEIFGLDKKMKIGIKALISKLREAQ